MRRIELDWNKIDNVQQMWDEIVTISGHPAWHGRNFHALVDGWVTGGLDEHGPPYEFIFLNCNSVNDELKELSEEVMRIAEESIAENGGSIRRS